ncbi:hypothetical protein [Nonomuraea jiangxiensis]|uniref:hypothetical protein n=1 Tax=Nonomuraea jiangxiensis TaxID=633440 RepID=UPI0015A11B23|nr:hypothetical protein [Nonomuraea jiangxiensis]
MSGLAALLGFLLGVFVGFGASATSEPATPKVTVTVEETEPVEPEATDPTEPVPSQPVPSEPVPSQTFPSQPVPSQTFPSQPVPSQSLPSQPVPSQPVPSQTLPGPGGDTDTGLLNFNPASLRTLAVGTDIQPGTYRTSGPTAGFSMCFWARLRSMTGGVIATAMPTGAATVTIQATDKAFQTGGCAEWIKA